MILKAFAAIGLFFVTSWAVHWLVWQIKRPEAYPIVLPLIFFGVPVGLVGLMFLAGLANFFDTSLSFVLAVLIPYFGLCLGYVMGYAGIIEYSPSAEILMEVQKNSKSGLKREEVRVESLDEYSITGKRIEHLLAAGLIRKHGDSLSISQKGTTLNKFLIFIRRLIGAEDFGHG